MQSNCWLANLGNGYCVKERSSGIDRSAPSSVYICTDFFFPDTGIIYKSFPGFVWLSIKVTGTPSPSDLNFFIFIF